MWAIVIYDKNSGEVIISRDRFGQKPLFYATNHDRLIFASELQAIVSVQGSKPNYGAIKSFIQEGSFDVGGATFFDQTYEFPISCYMRCKSGQIVDCQRYWHYPEKSRENSAGDDSFHKLLEDAVAIRLRTDVEYCLLLSGGLDSTLVTGITRQLVGAEKRLSAFTFSSKDKDDEVCYAQKAASELRVTLNVCSFPARTEDCLAILKNLVKALGRGHSSPAIISAYLLYKSISERGFKVALDGQGADELFAGYKHYHFHLIWEHLRSGRLSEITSLFVDLTSEGLASIAIMALRNSLPPWARKALRVLYGYESIFDPKRRFEVGAHTIAPSAPVSKSYSAFDRYLHKQHTVGLTNLLYYGDIVAMANSVENRSPFMDHRLVELAFQQGPLAKVRSAGNKAVLRSHPVGKRFADLFNRKKVGFNSPIDRQTRQRMLEKLRESEVLNWPIFSPTKIRGFLNDGRFVTKKYERFLFRLFQVHLWYEIFMADAMTSPEPPPQS